MPLPSLSVCCFYYFFVFCFGCSRRRPSDRILNEFLKLFQCNSRHPAALGAVHLAVINRSSQIAESP